MSLEFDEATHTYSIDGIVVPSVTQVLTVAGLLDPRWYTEESKARGKAVHAACHYIDEGDLDWSTVHPLVVPYVRAYEKFVKDTGFKPKLIEKAVCNETYFFAGTLDRFGFLQDDDCGDLIDIKSGASEPWHSIQMAGYGLCLPHMPRRRALYLKKDGSYKLGAIYTNPQDAGVFLSALTIANWKRLHGGKFHGNESRYAA